MMIAVFNFSDKTQGKFSLEVPDGTYQVVLNSEEECYGGSVKEKDTWIIEGHRLEIDIPAFCGIYIGCKPESDE